MHAVAHRRAAVADLPRAGEHRIARGLHIRQQDDGRLPVGIPGRQPNPAGMKGPADPRSPSRPGTGQNQGGRRIVEKASGAGKSGSKATYYLRQLTPAVVEREIVETLAGIFGK